MPLGRQTLILDADDTLWVNNLLFEQVINDFLEWIPRSTLDRAQMRAVLDEVEVVNTAAHGYGSRVFCRTLDDCFARLNERPASSAETQQIRDLATVLIEHRIELFPGVAETLEVLDSRHDLYLLTKGAADEQQRKIDASTLAHHFDGVHIVPEKRTETYLQLIEEYALDPSHTWMIGNSPRSDILPARRAGLGAVYIPDENPWALEHDVLDPADGHVLHLERFTDLTEHF